MLESSSSKTKDVATTVRERSDSEDSSSGMSIRPASLKSPRNARFAEATTVYSPVEAPPKTGRTMFAERPTSHFFAEPQVSDLGFGYVNKHESVEMPNTDYEPPVTATFPKSPLKSAMKTPGAPPKEMILSPTFREEQVLETAEKHTDRQQARDVRVKMRVRIAKFLLRGVNFSCSLIVLGMLGSTFSIFNATKTIPTRNNLPPWADNQKTWPQVLLLCISCFSLFSCMIIFYGYYQGGHNRAQKLAIWYTMYSIGYFIFSIVMWMVGLVVLQSAKNNDDNKDMWGWSCVDNTRHQLFSQDVSYSLICRLQNWSLVCAVIEVVVETITIFVYGVIIYRLLSKRKLRRTMAVRDRARSDLYLAQLRSQPNTPGVGPSGPLSPRDGGWRDPNTAYYDKAPMIEEGEIRYIDADKKQQPAPFRLQAPPIKIQNPTPKLDSDGFSPVYNSMPRTDMLMTSAHVRAPSPDATALEPLMSEPPAGPREVQAEHFGAAPGEQVYDAVPIPGAYEPPMSPTHAPHGY